MRFAGPSNTWRRAALLTAAAFAVAAAPADEATAAPCPGRDVPTTGHAIETVERAIACEVNQRRLGAGLAPVTFSPRLSEAARAHARDMRERAYFSLTSPDGETLADRAAASAYDGLAACCMGVIARGHADAAAVVAAWMTGSRNRGRLLSPWAVEIGSGADTSDPASSAAAHYALAISFSRGSDGVDVLPRLDPPPPPPPPPVPPIVHDPGVQVTPVRGRRIRIIGGEAVGQRATLVLRQVGCRRSRSRPVSTCASYSRHLETRRLTVWPGITIRLQRRNTPGRLHATLTVPQFRKGGQLFASVERSYKFR